MRVDGYEPARILPLPEETYDALKSDFAIAKHLSHIDKLCLEGVQAVVVRAPIMHEALLAAAYIIKKGERDGVIAEYEQLSDEYGAPFGDREVDSWIYLQSTLANVPIISGTELRRVFDAETAKYELTRNIGFASHAAQSQKRPLWQDGNYPLIVCAGDSYPSIAAVNNCGRLLIILKVASERPAFENVMFPEFSKKFDFEVECEHLTIELGSDKFYQAVLARVLEVADCRLGSDVRGDQVVAKLRTYRKDEFNGALDIEKLIKKVVRSKRGQSKVLRAKDFDKVFFSSADQARSAPNVEATAPCQLEQLIGLGEVKRQLDLLIRRISFEAERQKKGLPGRPTHITAVFMGNPGTAKTSVARAMGQRLNELGLLENGKFVEVTRKDLVGQYVGWTARTVANVFREASGGTLFIDEAYSLMDKNTTDGFSAEALAEIVTQMEDNPDTLVIFAGYKDKMQTFIQDANPGLRSRLTNIIEFHDYSAAEMGAIFLHLAAQEGYRVESEDALHATIARLLATLGSKNTGNGRLMRTLFKASVCYCALNEDTDYITISTEAVQEAAKDMIENARLLTSHSVNKVGF